MTTQVSVISTLKKDKNAYPHKVFTVKVEETHISWILLTGKFAYKIKKELKFGDVLDFSTLPLRKKFCQKEVQLNKILCPEMYRGIVKIVSKNDSYQIVEITSKGKPVEFAVKMQEMPQKYRMDNLLVKHKINLKSIDRLTDVIVKFHKRTPTNSKIKKFGQPKYIKKKIDENFRTLEKLTNVSPKYEKKLVSFLKNNKNLFYRRIKNNKIRDIHGDLYLKNIFTNGNSKFLLYDRLEFNDSLRYADVAEDIAHLAMDLDFYGRPDLSNYLISQYVIKSKDYDLTKLVKFFMCYKACMRGKVVIFRIKNKSITKKKAILSKEKKKLFNLAESYLDRF
ncbi:MAG: hypothetical protein IH841_06195 [Thaumarchaeota archaeon]|nr:hypothetical protein [Nitrososphaerota archaeon]